MRVVRVFALLCSMLAFTPTQAQEPPLWADQQQHLAPSIPEGSHQDYYGGSTVLRGDVAVVGASATDFGGFTWLGVVYVYERHGTEWVETARIEPPVTDRKNQMFFGGHIAFDGTTLVIGATAGDPRPRRELLMSKAVYDDHSVYERTVTREPRALFPSVYVYRKVGGVWTLEASIIDPGPAVNDAFGHNLAIGGDALAIGADDTYSAGQPYSGVVYTYHRINGVWTYTGAITSPQLQGWGHFGLGLDMDADGDTLAVGTLYELAVYVYKRSGQTWTFQDALLYNAPDGGFVYGAAVSVSPSGKRVAAGSLYERVGGIQTGAVDVFKVGDGGEWSLEQKLTVIGATSASYFGAYIDMDEKSLIGSTGWQWLPAQGVAGGPYVFTRDGGVWSQQSRLMIFDTAGFETSGQTISSGNLQINGDYAMMSPYNGNGSHSTAFALKIPGVAIDVTGAPSRNGVLALPPVGAGRTRYGISTILSVVLQSRPTADVIVHLQTDGAALFHTGDTSSDEIALHFTRDTWQIPQTVVVVPSAPDSNGVVSSVHGWIDAGAAVEYSWVRIPEFAVIIEDAPDLSVAPAVASESAGEVNFAISLSKPSLFDVTFAAVTADGTATGGVDYTSLAGAPFVIPAGSTSVIVPVDIDGDSLDEDDEQFTLSITNVVSAKVVTGEATGTLLDDDTANFSINDAVASEGQGVAALTISLSVPSVAATSVDWSIGAGTAQPADYIDVGTQTANFAAGVTTQTITIALVNDGLYEGTEVFTVTLTNPSGGATISPADAGIVTIVDTEPLVQIAPGDDTFVIGLPITFTWTPHPLAIRYRLKLTVVGEDGTLKTKNWQASGICTPDMCEATVNRLPRGLFKWRVIALGSKGARLDKSPWHRFARM